MGGIFAIYYTGFMRYSQLFLWQKLMILKMRGPDRVSNQLINNKLYLGFTQLRINDISSDLAKQPFDLHNVNLICGGEIFNHKQLRIINKFETQSHSDCEMIIHLYKKYGIEKTLEMIDGCFVFVLHDRENDVTYIAKDQFGVKPAYYGYDEYNNLIVGSERKAIHQLCKQIHVFPSGHYWSSVNNAFTRYFDLYVEKRNSSQIPEFNKNEYQQLIKNSFVQAVIKRMMSHRQIGCFLSGGVNSAVIASLLSKNLGQFELNTYSIGMNGYSDQKTTTQLAEHIKTDHTHITFNFEEVYITEDCNSQVIQDSIPLYLLAKYIQTHTNKTVIYSGVGSYLSQLDLDNKIFNREAIQFDRVFSHCGLELREPFLDKIFLKNYYKLPTDYRLNGDGDYYQNKWFLDIWLDKKLIPPQIVRNKIGDQIYQNNFQNEINKFISKFISDEQYNKTKDNYYPIPKSKFDLFVRKIYDQYYSYDQMVEQSAFN